MSLLNVRFRVWNGASGAYYDHTFILMCLYPSSYTVLSILSYGVMVNALKLRDMVPRVPALGRSLGSFIMSISSCDSCGVASRIEDIAPSCLLGLNVTLKTCSLLHSTVTFLGVMSNAEFCDCSGSRAVKLNLNGNFFLSKL